MKSLGEMLAAARRERQLTLRAVEAATGISNAYLSQLESGRIKSPSPTILHKLSEVYAVAYHDLLKAADYPVPGAGADAPAQSSAFAARIGHVTAREEEALLDYLAFLRSKTGKRTRM